jgi:protein tyrosine phosphatase (PTP) superfamily phosphohydrolase (DUF442 family)
MAIEEITNYILVSDQIASSGQPQKYEFKDIAQAGYQVVINLAMPDSDKSIPEEGSLVTAENMSYVHIPVPFEAPSAEHLTTFLGVMKAYSDNKVWVHCAVNKRVSAFLYQYQRLVCGQTKEQAAKVMLPDWEPNEIWKQFMELNQKDITQG